MSFQKGSGKRGINPTKTPKKLKKKKKKKKKSLLLGTKGFLQQN